MYLFYGWCVSEPQYWTLYDYYVHTSLGSSSSLSMASFFTRATRWAKRQVEMVSWKNKYNFILAAFSVHTQCTSMAATIWYGLYTGIKHSTSFLKTCRLSCDLSREVKFIYTNIHQCFSSQVSRLQSWWSYSCHQGCKQKNRIQRQCEIMFSDS